MGYEWIPAAVAATGSAVAGFAGQHPSKSRRYAKELADYQNEIALSNWNKQNIYDSPAAQMQRLEQAGVNPHFAFGAGANTSGAIGSGPSIDFDPNSMLPNEGKAAQGVANAISLYQQIRGSQIANSNAEVVKGINEAKREGEQLANIGRGLDNTSKELANRIQSATSDYQIELMATKLQDALLKYLNDSKYSETERKVAIDDRIAKTVNTRMDTDRKSEEILNLRKDREQSDARIRLINNQIDSIVQRMSFDKEKHPLIMQGLKIGNANGNLQYQAGKRVFDAEGNMVKYYNADTNQVEEMPLWQAKHLYQGDILNYNSQEAYSKKWLKDQERADYTTNKFLGELGKVVGIGSKALGLFLKSR